MSKTFIGIIVIVLALVITPIVVADTIINTCGTLSSSDIYILNESVTSSGTCFEITAENVTLDCNGSTITYSTAGESYRYGVYTNQFNTTIKNCIILDGNLTSTNIDRDGIYFNGNDYSTILNNYINVSGNESYAIVMFAGANFNDITNNTGISDKSHGILLVSSSNNNLINNTGISNSLVGIYLYSSSNNNTLTSNIGTSTSDIGIKLEDSSNNNILMNNVGTSISDPGIYLYTSSNNTLTNNNGTSNASTGIYLYSSSNNNLTNNTGMSNTNYAIVVSSSSNNNILTGNIGTSNSESGIYLETSINNILTENTGTSNSSSGILLYSANNTILTNNNGTSDTNYGILISSSSNNTLLNNTGTSNINVGLYLYISSNNTLSNNNGISDTSTGIQISSSSDYNVLADNTGTSQNYTGLRLESSSYNVLINNIGTSNGTAWGAFGIYLYNSTNNTLISNTGTSNAFYGIILSTSTNNTLILNNGTSRTSTGIDLLLSSRNNLINNTGKSDSGIGIQFEISSDNAVIGNTGTSNTSIGISVYITSLNNLTGNNATGAIGYLVESTNYTTISDCVYTSGTSYDIYIDAANYAIENTFINCTYSTESINGADNYIIRQWYFNTNITNSTGSPIDSANVTIYNSTGGLIYSGLTNASGNIDRTTITEYVNTGGTKSYSTPHTINVTKTGYYTNSTTFNLSNTSNTKVKIMLNEVPTLQCDVISSSGIYTLESNVTSNGTCFTITADNVTLDCQGHTIIFSTSGIDDAHGIYSTRYNTTVKNCRIIDGNFSSNQTWRNGITYVNVNDGRIENNIINVSYGKGIRLDSSLNNILLNNSATSNSGNGIMLASSSNYNSLINNSGYCTGAFDWGIAGIQIYNSDYNNLTNNTGNSVNNFAIFLNNADNNILTRNIGISNTSRGIHLYISSNNTLINNRGMTTSGQAIYISYSSNYNILINNTGNCTASYSWGRTGIGIDNSSYNNLTNNRGEAINNFGILLTYSTYNSLIGNIGLSSSHEGIYLTTSSDNTLIRNNGTSNSNVGISLYSNTNDTLLNNTGSSNTFYGILIDTSSYNVLTNNRGISSTSQGIFLASSDNNQLTSNTGSSNSNYGIHLLYSNNAIMIANNGSSISNIGIILDSLSNNSLTNNTGTSNNSEGIYVYNATNVIFTNNNGTSNSNYGIFFYRSSNNVLTSNKGTSNTNHGIILSESTYNTLTGNVGSSDTNVGLYIYSSSNNNVLTNNKGTSDSNSGIIIETSINNNLTNNSGISSTQIGIYLISSSNDTLTHNNVTGAYGYYIRNSSDILIYDCSYTSTSSLDIYIHPDNYSVNNRLINCTYNITKEGVEGLNNSVLRQWYLETNITDGSGSPLSGVNVAIYNSSGGLIFSGTTDSNGNIGKQTITEYVNTNGTRAYSTPHNITISKSGYYSNSTIINMSATLNAISNLQLTIIPSTPVDTGNTGSNGGGSGGGGGPGLYPVNISFGNKSIPDMASINKYWPTLIKGIRNIDINENGMPLTYTSISINTDANIANTLKITAQVTNPTNNKINATIYKYIIFNTTIEKNYIDNITIKFKVEKNWIKQHNMTKDNVKLYTYDSRWIATNISISSEDSSYIYYSTKSKQLSNLAIGGPIIIPIQKPITANITQPKIEQISANKTDNESHIVAMTKSKSVLNSIRDIIDGIWNATQTKIIEMNISKDQQVLIVAIISSVMMLIIGIVGGILVYRGISKPKTKVRRDFTPRKKHEKIIVYEEEPIITGNTLSAADLAKIEPVIEPISNPDMSLKQVELLLLESQYALDNGKLDDAKKYHAEAKKIYLNSNLDYDRKSKVYDKIIELSGRLNK